MAGCKRNGRVITVSCGAHAGQKARLVHKCPKRRPTKAQAVARGAMKTCRQDLHINPVKSPAKMRTCMKRLISQG